MPDGEKEDREKRSEVGECGDRVVREAGLVGIGCHLSLSEPERVIGKKRYRLARYLEILPSVEPDRPERAVFGTGTDYMTPGWTESGV
jgi:hypothetical protein